MATKKFVDDLAARLSEIARAGATPTSVTALMVSIRRVIENTKTQNIHKLAWLFCTWSMHTTMDQNKAIPYILEGINDVIVPILQGSFTGVVTKAISEKLQLEDLRSELVDVCTHCGVDASPVRDADLWEKIRHQLLDILSEIIVSLPVNGCKFKSLSTQYPSATLIVSSIEITRDSGSPLLREQPYYWRISLTDISNLNALPRTIVGAVIF
jgi:hypothetical protein